jgi:nicotinamidase-related amidase
MSRIWDTYLSDQDREHVQLSGKRPFEAGNSPALLLVDLYRWVFGDTPEPLLDAVKTWPGSCGMAGWQALPKIQRLLAEARRAELPVIYITGLDGMPDWATPGRRQPGEREANPEMEERRRRANDIVDEVLPLPAEVVLRKSAPSAFWGTPLVGHLNYLRADTVLVVGESTSGCVRASVVDGRSYRFNMVVVEDCVFDRHEATHAINLFDMDQKYADVVDLDFAVSYVRKHAAWIRESR